LKKWEIGKFKNQDLTQYQLSNIAEGNDKAFLTISLSHFLSYFLTFSLSHYLTFSRELGWKPKTSLEEGIKTTYEWYVSTREAKQTRQTVNRKK